MKVIAFPPEARIPLNCPLEPVPLSTCESSVVCQERIKSAMTNASMPVPRSMACRDRSCCPAIVRTGTESRVSSASVSETAVFCVSWIAVDVPVVIRLISSDIPAAGSAILFVAKSAVGRPARARGAARSTRYCGTTSPAKFDEVLCVGDEIDFQTISRWAEKTPLAYQQTIHQDREECKQILWDLGEYSREMHIIRSNHSDRLYNTLLKTPGLISLPELQYPKFMGFAEMGMTYHKTAYEFHPGWVLCHGDEGSMSQHAGITLTALTSAKRISSGTLLISLSTSIESQIRFCS